MLSSDSSISSGMTSSEWREIVVGTSRCHREFRWEWDSHASCSRVTSSEGWEFVVGIGFAIASVGGD
jgi:hypothetical protein